MKRGKRAVLCMLLSGMVCMLAACSVKLTKIYEDDHINAVVQEEEGQAALAVDVRFTSAAPGLSETTLAEITKDGPKKEYEVQLSDGVFYGYHDGTLDQESEEYIRVFGSMEEMEATLERNLPFGSTLEYPQGAYNFILMYDRTGQSLSVNGAEVSGPEGLSVKWSAQLIFVLEEGDRNTFYISDVTENMQHETYTTAKGLEMELFWDEETGKAGVFLMDAGAYYVWDLTGELDGETVRAFADTIE